MLSSHVARTSQSVKQQPVPCLSCFAPLPVRIHVENVVSMRLIAIISARTRTSTIKTRSRCCAMLSAVDLQDEGIPRDPLRVHQRGHQELADEQEGFLGDRGTADRPEELRSPEGQAFQRHGQVRYNLFF